MILAQGETGNCSYSQEISILLWKVNIHFVMHMSPPLGHIISQPNPINILTLPSSKIYSNIIFPLLIFISSVILLRPAPNKIFYADLSPSVRVICPDNLAIAILRTDNRRTIKRFIPRPRDILTKCCFLYHIHRTFVKNCRNYDNFCCHNKTALACRVFPCLLLNSTVHNLFQ